MYCPAAWRYCRTRTILPSGSNGSTTTEPGCVTTSRIVCTPVGSINSSRRTPKDLPSKINSLFRIFAFLFGCFTFALAMPSPGILQEKRNQLKGIRCDFHFPLSVWRPAPEFHLPATRQQQIRLTTSSAHPILSPRRVCMSVHRTLKRLAHLARVGFASFAAFQLSIGGTLAQAANEKQEEKESKDHRAQSPIQHVIIIVGENRSFDHLFATYKPKHGQRVDNLLSKAIIKADGTPGPNYSLALQYQADVSHDPVFELAPSNKTPYSTLPPALTGGPSDVCKDNGICTLND